MDKVQYYRFIQCFKVINEGLTVNDYSSLDVTQLYIGNRVEDIFNMVSYEYRMNITVALFQM